METTERSSTWAARVGVGVSLVEPWHREYWP